MPNRIHHDDFKELLAAAKQALTLALADGERKGFVPGHWLTQDATEHLAHADRHLSAIVAGAAEERLNPEQERTHLTHLICRAVMEWAKRENK